MLVFISDLHFVDETAGEHNIPTRAFEGVFEDLKNFLDGLKKYSGKPTEVKIIFLGDIFDLNRTTYWLKIPEAQRPWGDIENNRALVETHANAIFDEIIDKNKETFTLLSGSLEDTFKYSDEPERLYIPGNHDRLCNIFDSLREKVRINLGIKPVNEDKFLHVFNDKDVYKVIAWHGHEFDVMNYEGTTNYTDSDYAQIPIGDLITTEIASRLPYTIMQHVENMSPAMPEEEKESLKRNLQEIENVRPYTAVFDWLFYQVSENPELKKEINESLKEIVASFNSLQYLNRWYKRHDKWNIFTSDEADKLQSVIRLFKLFDVDEAETLLKIYSKIFGSPDNLPMDNADKALIDTAKNFLTRTSEYRYCVMGHTHNPMQVPIRITSSASSELEQIYLNTGTWRKRYIKGQAGGFIGLKHLTYTIIYSEEEKASQRFETWTGSLKEVPST
jgi:UDP-2,3-diacylglucosamine pyrophosphatase LpxH